jgi:hypothetical protein
MRLWLVFLVLLPAPVWAAPDLSSATLTCHFADANSCVLSQVVGHGPASLPLHYEDFESGNPGDVYTGYFDASAAQGCDSPKYSTARSFGNSGTQSAIVCGPVGHTEHGSSYINKKNENFNIGMYVSWWEWRHYSEGTLEAGSNKYLRFQTDGMNDGCPSFYISISAGQGAPAMMRKNNPGCSPVCDEGVVYFGAIDDQWVRYEVWWGRSIDYWTVFRHTPTGIDTFRGTNCSIVLDGTVSQMLLGQSFEEYRYVYLDNVLLAKSRARVEWGNKPSWSEVNGVGGRRYVMQVTNWSDDITFTMRRSGINDGESGWLYVVAADGSVNDTGFPVREGQIYGGDPLLPPAPPEGLRVL